MSDIRCGQCGAPIGTGAVHSCAGLTAAATYQPFTQRMTTAPAPRAATPEDEHGPVTAAELDAAKVTLRAAPPEPDADVAKPEERGDAPESDAQVIAQLRNSPRLIHNRAADMLESLAATVAERDKTIDMLYASLNREGAKAREDQATIAGLRRDAERYRWLRDYDPVPMGGPMICCRVWDGYHFRMSKESVDAAIDAAKDAAPPETGSAPPTGDSHG